MYNRISPEWIALDWGATRLRAWAMEGATMLAAAQSGDGMNTLEPARFEPALLGLVESWLGGGAMPVVACGMIGVRQGRADVPYRAAPAQALPGALPRVRSRDTRIALHVVPGLKQAAPPDIMRGEETRIAGFLALNKGWDGVICLPGAHTKWVQISAGEVVSFQTFMTGELFAMLSAQSILRHSVGAEGWDAPAFAEAIEDTMSKPERLAARLFTLRARDLLEDQPHSVARARLSGLLIGAELAAARPYWLGQNLAILGTTETAARYAQALEAVGAAALIADGERMTLAGLTAAYRLVRGPT